MKMYRSLMLLVILELLQIVGYSQIRASNRTQNVSAEKFETLLNYIQTMYVDTVDMDMLVEKAIISMLEELDPHSVYFSQKELQEANEPLQGSFDGIGIQFNIMHDTIFVVEPIQGGPSEKLGIQAGDKIVQIEGNNVAGVNIKNNDVLKYLRGPKGTHVSIGIMRKNIKGILPYTITRDKIPIYSVDASYMVTPTVGFIKVSRFAATTTQELKEAIVELKNQGMQDLILDLQDNGGGLLKAAFEMADEFINDDKLLVYTEGRAFPRENYTATKNIKGNYENGRLIILIDENSASASEIVSGAIQDWDRGLLVGRRSFGKGLVQRPVPLPDGSAVRLTVQHYYTPSGRCIQKPYENGKDDYYDDYSKRLKNGEFFSSDSIQFPDSLRYQTNITHRTVYGGGGVMPDVFVPLDTTENSLYFANMLRVNVQNDWALSFVNAYREQLLVQYPTVEDFMHKFEFSNAQIQEVIELANKKGVEFNELEYNRSKRAIEIRTKALVARNLYNNEAFYVVIGGLNDALQKAIQILQSNQYQEFNLDRKSHSGLKFDLKKKS